MFKIAAVFSSNMVLQREKNIEIWGDADDGALIKVEINGSSAQTKAADGKWKIILPPMEAGGPYEMDIYYIMDIDGRQIKESLRFYNVMIGEVWLCGGQSNMELELQNCKGGRDILKTLSPDCPIRFYYTSKCKMVDEELYNAEKSSGWSEAGEQSSAAWSAVGYFFAKKLAEDLGVTVGLIGCNWGGTSASAWMDRKTIADCKETVSYIEEYDLAVRGKPQELQIREYDEYAKYQQEWWERSQKVYEKEPNCPWDKVLEICGESKYPGPMNCKNEYRPSGLYETMLMRVCPYTLRGFLYYQGESDDHKPNSYYKLFTNLIGLWREKWGDDELPFIMVQLPMFKYEHDPDYKHWCLIREAQMKAFKTIKNTGIAVITDCGEFNNIHPVDKAPVGKRLCLQAESLVYGMKVDAFGPIFKSLVFVDGGILLSFDHAKKGFKIKGDKITGFEIAGEDKLFRRAKAEIRGDRIFISAKQVAEPKYARFDWSNWEVVTVFGKNGIPLAPFRTDTD
ncbi:MAG: sialate O-acetylesterase [Ruminococcus sp.]|nr:sialate O-acetylesterase [Ruminococcus sp.]